MPPKKLISEKEAAKLRPIDAYTHDEHTRPTIPRAGLSRFDKSDQPPTTYSFDPHFSPALDWSGKSEGLSFDVPASSLHIHETVNPARVLNSVRKNLKSIQTFFGFHIDEIERMNKRNAAIEFYSHRENWTNRMIAGDSLVIMNSLIQRENMSGQVQTVYIDPPYGIKYGSNFQPFINKRDVKDKSDEDLTREPEMIKAFRDTWELGIHSYLTYLRNRLLLVRELLSQTGSVFVQISDENVHLVRCLLDEIFGTENFVSMISLEKTSGASSTLLATINDYILWYAKDKKQVKYHQLYKPKKLGQEGTTQYVWIEIDGEERRMTEEEKRNIPNGARVFAADNCTSAGKASEEQPFTYEGKTYYPSKNRHWRITYPEGMQALAEAGRLKIIGNTIMYKQYLDDFPVIPINNTWDDTKLTGFTEEKLYVVQTASDAIARCILMSSDPGDLVLDITCGSGTTAYVAEQWGRRWITCDTSRVALAIARQRLLTASYDYYKLADVQKGIDGGFVYKTVPHVTLKSIANDEEPAREILYDAPEFDKGIIRVTGPFTIEAVPSPVVLSVDEAINFDDSESAKVSDWRAQLQATGILGRNGERIKFARIEEKPGMRFLTASGETDENKHALICFAGENSLMDARRVISALDEAEDERPAPELIIFAAFQFDPEASKVIANTRWDGVSLLQVQMNPDLITEDLKKKVNTDQSFYLVGQPDVVLENVREKVYRVKVIGFDYYDVNAGKVISGDADKISMWMLDSDYDGMSINPSQIFFPMEGKSGGWNKLANTLKAELDLERLEAFRGNSSLEFEAEEGQRIAVKIIDDRGIESMRILTV